MMDPSEYLREVSNTLFKYQQDDFLCDVVIVTSDRIEMHAHSIILAAVSSKLRAAFEKSDNTSIKQNYMFKLNISDCNAAIVGLVLQFVYTGTIVLSGQMNVEINSVLYAGQKLGLDPTKLAGCLGAMLCLSDAR